MIKKLYKFIDNSPDNVIKWSNDGNYIIISNKKVFEEYIKEKEKGKDFFKSKQFDSFKRRISYHKFKKLRCKDARDNILKEATGSIGGGVNDVHVFYHAVYKRDYPDYKQNISSSIKKRKIVSDMFLNKKKIMKNKSHLEFFTPSVFIEKIYPSFLIPSVFSLDKKSREDTINLLDCSDVAFLNYGK